MEALGDHFLTRNAKLEWWTPGRKTVVLHATLPGGFEIVVSAHADRAEKHDPEAGKEVCLRKLRDRVKEYESAKGQLRE